LRGSSAAPPVGRPRSLAPREFYDGSTARCEIQAVPRIPLELRPRSPDRGSRRAQRCSEGHPSYHSAALKFKLYIPPIVVPTVKRLRTRYEKMIRVPRHANTPRDRASRVQHAPSRRDGDAALRRRVPDARICWPRPQASDNGRIAWPAARVSRGFRRDEAPSLRLDPLVRGRTGRVDMS